MTTNPSAAITKRLASTRAASPITDTVARARVGRRAAVLAPLALALIAWGYSLSRVKVESVGLYGLLASVDGWYFVALALIVFTQAVELIRARPRLWVLSMYLIGLILVIHASVPVLVHAPEYGWVYKHLGVIAALGSNGRITQPNDIYQAWPALFAGVAGLVSQSGTTGLALAKWAPPFFELLDSLILLGIFRVLTRSTRVSFLAVTIFVGCAAWVGQDYLSPQAFAFAMWLGVVLVIVRWLLPAAASRRADRPLGRARAWITANYDVAAPQASPAARRAAVVVVLALFFVMVAAHQLSPYMALAAVVTLALLDLVRPRWIIFLLAAIAFGFLAPRYHVIASQFGGLFSGFDVVHNASTAFSNASNPEKFTARAVHYVSAGTWALAALSVLSLWRTRGRLAVPAVLAFTPFLILGAQSYGGEAIFRVFLFSSPWCALLIASRIVVFRRILVRRALVLTLPAAAVLLGTQGLYGPFAVDVFTANEVKASAYLYAHISSNSMLLPVASNFPLQLAANSDSIQINLVPSDPIGAHYLFDARNERALDNWAAHFQAPHVYLIFSRSMAPYAGFFLYPQGYTTIERHVAHDRSWKVYYRNPDVTVYTGASGSGI